MSRDSWVTPPACRIFSAAVNNEVGRDIFILPPPEEFPPVISSRAAGKLKEANMVFRSEVASRSLVTSA